MDDIVKAAMAKWPHVPACMGWLGLDARGAWWMRDDGAQAAGSFQQGCAEGNAAVKGSRLQHEGLLAFITRNYAVDEHGRWYFQNGPQRVFVELEAAPWVLRVSEQGQVSTMDGQPAATVHGSYCDEHGRFFLHTNRGLGLVHSQDMLCASTALDAGLWPQPVDMPFAQMPAHFGFVCSPQNSPA